MGRGYRREHSVAAPRPTSPAVDALAAQINGLSDAEQQELSRLLNNQTVHTGAIDVSLHDEQRHYSDGEHTVIVQPSTRVVIISDGDTNQQVILTKDAIPDFADMIRRGEGHMIDNHNDLIFINEGENRYTLRNEILHRETTASRKLWHAVMVDLTTWDRPHGWQDLPTGARSYGEVDIMAAPEQAPSLDNIFGQRRPQREQ